MMRKEIKTFWNRDRKIQSKKGDHKMKHLTLDVSERIGGKDQVIGTVMIDHIENSDDLQIMLQTMGCAYVCSRFNYGHDVATRSRFKQSKNGTSKEDKIAREYGFNSVSEMREALTELKKSKSI
jgi:hypothetical protein